MKLYDPLPDSVTVNGKKIRLDLDFRNVLRMLDIMKTDNMMPEAREYLAMKCICRRPRKGMMESVSRLLFPNTEDRTDHTRITDFEQDADLIQAAFMQEYGINLFRDRLHWFEFSALLAGLPQGSRYSEILSIRARPVPAPTQYNAEERNWLLRAKSEYSIRMDEKEQAMNYERNVQQIGQALASFIGGGE